MPEQQKILDDPSRVRIVRAAPGSGKTWLIAEEIRRRMNDWPFRHAGIAALSFTNVARDEINGSVGSGLQHPHFVGTIDAFVFQYIVRPFAQIYDSRITTPRLIPAPLADALSDKQKWHPNSLFIQVGPESRDREHLFRINAVRAQGDKPVYRAKYGRTRTVVEIDGAQASYILQRKRNIWCESGFMSHSDVTYLAAQILQTARYGKVAADLLTRRFPLLIVDELQDTGYYLARVVYQLVAHSQAFALLVGDPDQAIYEFNGARPDLFAQFEQIPGSAVFPMRTTQRCARHVCKVFDALSDSGAQTSPNGDRAGAAILITHQDSLEERRSVGEALRGLPAGTTIRTLARKTRTMHNLLGTKIRECPAFGSRSIKHLHDAVNALRQGDMAAALAKAGAAVGVAVFDTESPSYEMLAEKQIEARAWRQGSVELLLNVNVEKTGEDLYDWGCRAKAALEEIVTRRGWIKNETDWQCAVRRPQRNVKGKLRHCYLAAAKESLGVWGGEISTVHGAKGETHDVTVLYVPKTDSEQCPATTWWSGAADHKEERRVAFVAASRPRHLFVLCAHAETVERLRRLHPDFVALFQEIPIDQNLTASLKSIYFQACAETPCTQHAP
jgi:DNA helicase-2/ATP-dependent DNA helicase PcrA